MLTALTSEGIKVYAHEVNKEDEVRYYCPECGSELILRQGTKNIWHFAHKEDNGICIFRKYDNESIHHKMMKATIKEIVENDNDCIVSDLEHKIGSKIADYYFEIKGRFNGIRKVAVECVQSHTDIDVFRAKNEYYVKQGVYVLWVFNLTRFLNKDNSFKEEVRVNEIIKECHTMYYGKVYAIDIPNQMVYAIHLDQITREVEEQELIDWDSWDGHSDPNELGTYTVGGYEYFLKGTRSPNPKMIKEFIVSSFKKAWDNNSLKFLPYRRNVANVYLQKWW